MNKIVPNFFIIGAMKAGTSNLRTLMLQHSDIEMADLEVNYFSNEKNYGKGKGWYLDHFKGLAGKKWIGEKSPNYYFYPQAPERIHSLSPDAKLILIVRDPVARAYSDYWFSVYRGKEYKTFSEAVDLEINGTRQNMYRRYLERSTYSTYYTRYTQHFDKKNILIISFEEMKSNPQAACDQCFDFLGIERVKIEQTQKAKNFTYMPRLKMLNYWSNRFFKRSIPKVYNIIRELNKQSEAGYDKIDPAIERRLIEYFEPLNKEFKDLSGFETSYWNKKSK